ncbi:MAG: hypothetical protein Q8Q08_00540 [Candidatus Omnitrophota bacterium]|nr:hypothetical protein [Candidatus Omnitrophota bacterium]MDZ4241901.1 hypothetical protein [Candidatus Omnitrophota bacterium]
MDNLSDQITMMLAAQVALFVVIILAAVLYHRRQTQRHFRWMQAQAAKRGGRVKPATLFSYPEILIPDQGGEIRIHLTAGSRYSPPRTHAFFRFPIPKGYKIHVYRESVLHKAVKVLGLQDIQLGHPAFDQEFIIQGSDPHMVRNFLTSEIQHTLLLAKDFYPSLEIKNEMKLSVPRHFKEEQEYDSFIDSAMAVLRRLSQMA